MSLMSILWKVQALPDASGGRYGRMLWFFLLSTETARSKDAHIPEIFRNLNINADIFVVLSYTVWVLKSPKA